MSSNPFRRKAVAQLDTTNTTSSSTADASLSRFPPIEAIDTFKAEANVPYRQSPPPLPSHTQPRPTKSSMRDESPAAREDRKKKATRRVRVMSPPPLSPDSPNWPANVPPAATQAFQHSPSVEYEDDPFGGASADESESGSGIATPPPPPPHPPPLVANQPPPNPFSKTLRDLEGSQELEKERAEEGEALKAANSAPNANPNATPNAPKASLNVDSFRRLLMTGKADPETAPITDIPDTTSTTIPSTDHHKATAWHTSQGSTESTGEDTPSDSSASIPVQTSQEKKSRPPPPPSSRHGRSLRGEKDGGQYTIEPSKRISVIESKPLPSAPLRGNVDETESSADKEASSKALDPEPQPQPQPQPEPEPEPEPEPPTVVASPSSVKKAAPAPPPRRGTGRAEPKVQHLSVDEPAHGEETPSRSSSESLSPPSRSDTVRLGSNAPAPPPPRRPLPAPRQAPGAAAPGALAPSPAASPAVSPPAIQTLSPPTQQTDLERPLPADPPIPSKIQAPPPPPARHSSTRRPTSVSSFDGVSRRVSSEGRGRDSMPPPPPPPRQRGSSPSNASRDTAAQSPTEPGLSTDILADLDALQREVDALRSKIH